MAGELSSLVQERRAPRGAAAGAPPSGLRRFAPRPPGTPLLTRTGPSRVNQTTVASQRVLPPRAEARVAHRLLQRHSLIASCNEPSLVLGGGACADDERGPFRRPSRASSDIRWTTTVFAPLGAPRRTPRAAKRRRSTRHVHITPRLRTISMAFRWRDSRSSSPLHSPLGTNRLQDANGTNSITTRCPDARSPEGAGAHNATASAPLLSRSRRYFRTHPSPLGSRQAIRCFAAP